MTKRKMVKRIVPTTPINAAEAQRLNAIRRQAMEDFPPEESPPGIPSRIRAARRAKKLSWRAVARAAGISGPRVVRAIELGHDTQVADLEAVARVPDLRLERIAADA
jgi:hypothetical protein